MVADDDRVTTLPKQYWWQAIAFYGLIAIGYPLLYIFAEHGTMTDPTGRVWRAHDFRETSAIMSLYTMFVAVDVSSVKLLQKRESD